MSEVKSNPLKWSDSSALTPIEDLRQSMLRMTRTDEYKNSKKEYYKRMGANMVINAKKMGLLK